MATKKIAKIEIIKPGSNPDVDSDFSNIAREPAIDYVTNLYGKDNVANIVTFGTLAAKSAFKAMCTIYEVPFVKANKISNLVPPPIEGKDCTLADIYDPNSDRYTEAAEFREATSGEEWTNVIAGARAIEGRNKSTGVHACGIIISSKPLYETIPLHVRQDDKRTITQWTYQDCESLGLIKMDFLGLDNVDLTQITTKYIMRNGKKPVKLLDLIYGPMDDPKVYEMFQKAETTGIFQFGSEMVQKLLLQVKPTEFIDLATTTAIARPGPMGMQSHIKYADRKNGREKIDYIHPEFVGSELEKILGKTYGILVFQEQIMQISAEIAGMTLQEGDALRKAMGKKKMDVMMAMKPKFFEGAKENGYSEEAITVLWDNIEEFAKYGFNLCAHGDTIVIDKENHKIRLRDLYKRWENGETDIELMSMWEDGTIKPHKVRKVVYTGKKRTFEIKTESGKSIKITKEHRLLTTNGYGSIDDGGLTIGTELIIDEEKRPFGITDQERERRRNNMTTYNKSDLGRQKASETMTKTQSRITFEERSYHQKRIQEKHPNRNTVSMAKAREKLAYLRANDPVWVKNFCETMARMESSGKKGYGKVTQISDGRVCDSIVEAAAAEYLLARGVKFELHKVIENPKTGMSRISDFYVDGIYFEMDGLFRGEQWFKDNKYGDDVPFVYLNPYNFVDKIDEALSTLHAKNGDKIVSIVESERNHKVYDIEMQLEGPSNFIADGIVSHNSHSVAYAMNSYQSAYLKVHYQVEFMAALLSLHTDDKKKTLTNLREAKRMGISVGTVDINLSDVQVAPDFSGTSEKDILFGLSGIKQVSERSAEIIVQEREKNGKYTSVQDVIKRCMPLGITVKSVYVNLAQAGAFDSFNVSRKQITEKISDLMNNSKKTQTMGTSLFDAFMIEDSPDEITLTGEEYPYLKKLQLEADMIGLYLTANPMDNIGSSISTITNSNIKELLRSPKRTTKEVIGTLIDIKRKNKKNGKMITVDIDDGKSYMNARLSKKVVKSIEKMNAQETVKNAYLTGKRELSPETRNLAVDHTIKEMDDIVANNIYVMNITYQPGRDDSPYSAQINWMKPLNISEDGSLPIRIRYRLTKNNIEKMRILYKKIPPALSKKQPGNYPIYVSNYHENIPDFYRTRTKLFEKALETIDNDETDYTIKDKEPEQKVADNSSLINSRKNYNKNISKTNKANKGKKNKEHVRQWPPKLDSSEKCIINLNKINVNDQDIMKDVIESIDQLEYKKTDFTCDKNNDVAMLIEKFLGAENYDFGVFNIDILNNND